ncbi:MAG: nucleoside deaminase [Bacilli bacterium]
MTDLEYMNEAYKEALVAYQENEVPVGCIIVYKDKIITKSHNRRHNDKCSLYHAEILAIEKACKVLDRWILSGCTMYVTLSPCIMCTGAVIQSRIERLVVGAEDERFGCCKSILDEYGEKQNHQVILKQNVMKKEIEQLMKNFFAEIRKNKKEEK